MKEARLPPLCLSGNNVMEYTNDMGSMMRRFAIIGFEYMVQQPDPMFKSKLAAEAGRILWKVNLAYIQNVRQFKGAFPAEWKLYFEDTFRKYASDSMDRDVVSVLKCPDEFINTSSLHVYMPLKDLLAKFATNKKKASAKGYLAEHLKIRMRLPYPRRNGASGVVDEYIFGIDRARYGDDEFELSGSDLTELKQRSGLVFEFWPSMAQHLEISEAVYHDQNILPESVWQFYVTVADLAALWNEKVRDADKRVSSLTLLKQPVMEVFPVVMARLPYGISNSVILGHFVFGLRIKRRNGHIQAILPAEYIEYVLKEYAVEDDV